MLVSLFSVAQDYKITGTVSADYNDKPVYLINKNGGDTIARSTVVDGKFSFAASLADQAVLDVVVNRIKGLAATVLVGEGADAGGENKASCRVAFGQSYAGGECKVFIDDSLLYAGAPLPVDSQLVMRRYAAPGSRQSLYTSKSLLKVVAGSDTVVRALQGDREFVIELAGEKVVISVVEK